MQFLTHYKKTIALVLAVTMALLSPMTSFAESEVTAKDSFGSMIEDILPEKEILVEKDIALGTEDAAQDKSVSAETVTDIKNVLTDIASENDTGFAESEQDFIACSDPVDGIVVTVKAKAGVLPADAKLVAEKVDSATVSEDIEAAVDNTKIIDGNEDETDVQPAVSSELSTKRSMLDIAILDENGNEIEPDGEVEIKFTLTEAVANLTGIRVFHAEDSIEKLTKIAEKIEKAEAEGIESELEFPDGEVFDDVNQKVSKKDVRLAAEKPDAFPSDYSDEENITDAEGRSELKETPYVAEELEVIEPSKDEAYSTKVETATAGTAITGTEGNNAAKTGAETDDAPAPLEFAVITDSLSPFVLEFTIANLNYIMRDVSQKIPLKTVMIEMGILEYGDGQIYEVITKCVNPSDTKTNIDLSTGEGLWSIADDSKDAFVSAVLEICVKHASGPTLHEITISRRHSPVVIKPRYSSKLRYYDSLQEAIDAFETNDEKIILIDDIVLPESSNIRIEDKDCIIKMDFDGHSITGSYAGPLIQIIGSDSTGVEVEFSDSSDSKTGKIINKLDNANAFVIKTEGIFNKDRIRITDGYYEGFNAIFAAGADLSISGGEFHATGTDGYAMRASGHDGLYITISNRNGIPKFDGAFDCVELCTHLQGGLFSDRVDAECCDYGYRQFRNEDPSTSKTYSYMIDSSADAAAENTKTGLAYRTVKQAVDEADHGDTVKVLADVLPEHPATETVNVSKDITLNLNGHKYYAGLQNAAAFNITENATLTVTSTQGSLINSSETAIDATAGALVIDGHVSVTAEASDAVAIKSGNRLTVRKADTITGKTAVEVHMDASANLPYLYDGTYNGELHVTDKEANSNKVHITGGKYGSEFSNNSSRTYVTEAAQKVNAAVVSGSALFAFNAASVESMASILDVFYPADGYSFSPNEDESTKTDYPWCVKYGADYEAFALNPQKPSEFIVGDLTAVLASPSVGDGWTVALLKDVSTDATVSKNITINLGKSSYTGLLTIDGAEVSVTDGALKSRGDSSSAVITIKNRGKLLVDTNNKIEIDGIINVTGEGSELKITDSDAVLDGTLKSSDGGSIIIEKDCYFKGTIKKDGNGSICIRAGYFDKEPDHSFIEDGYSCVRESDGRFHVRVSRVVVKLSDGTQEYFNDPQAAFNAVKDNSDNAKTRYDESIISLERDFEGNYYQYWTKNHIILDLGNYSITAKDSGYYALRFYSDVTLRSGTIHGDMFLQSDYGVNVPEDSEFRLDGTFTIGGNPGTEPQKSRIIVRGGYYSKPQKSWFVNDENYGRYFTARKELRDEFPYTVKKKSEPVFSVPVPNDGTVVYADRLEDAIYSLNRMSYTNPARITMIGDNVTESSLIIKNPVTFAFADESGDKHYTGNITVSDGGVLYVESGKYDTVFNTSSDGKIQISGGYFKNAPLAVYIAEGYAVVANTDTDTKDVYKYKVVNLKDADCEAKVLHNDGTARYYLKLSDALNSVAEGDERETVYLLKDVTVRNPDKGAGGTASLEPIAFEKSVILDLNQNKLTIGGTNTDGHPEYIGDIQVKPGKNVVIKNGSIDTTMPDPHRYAHSMFQLCDGANITFSNVDIKGFCPVDFFEDISNQATAVFEGTDTKVEGYSLVSSQPTDPAKTKLVVNDGSYTLDSWYFVCLEDQSRNLSKTTREINGGQFVIHEWGVSKWSDDATTIYGGGFNLLPDQASVTVKDGRGIVKNAADAKYPWSVGDPSELDCEAYVPGTYNNNKIYYRTIGTAINDIHETKTVTLCRDATLKETVVASCSDAGKIITLDLNGKKLTSSDKQTISVAEDTTLKITSSNGNGTFTNFTTGNSAGGKIIFENVNVEGSVRLLDCETEIISGKWKISTMSLPSIESGKLRISGGKFNTKLSEGYLATGCYFFDNPDADRDDYPYLVDQGYTVSFVLNGYGGEIAPVTARAEHTLAAPATPSDVSYSFDGWFTENGASSGNWGDQWDFDTDKVTEDTTLYAKWTIKKYTASFDMHGHGAQIASQSVAHGGKIAEPPTPSESGYIFNGWFKEDGTESGNWGEKWNFEEDTVTADKTLHAKWTEAEASLKKQGESTAVYFASLSDAMDVAGDGNTVTLLKNITIPAGNLLWKRSSSIAVTFDLNGKTITGNYAGPLLDIENIKLSIIDSSAAGSGESAGTIENKSDSSSAYVLRLMTQYGWIPLKISAGNYIGYNGIEFKDYNIDLSNLNITAQGNALKDTQNIVEDIAISSGKFKGSIIVENSFDGNYGKITGGLFTHKLDSRLYAGNSAPHRQFRSGDADYPYTVDKSENAAAENCSDTDKNIEGLGYYSLSQAVSDASENAKIRVLKPVTSDTEISRSDIEITGNIEVKDSALLEIKAGKYDGVLSKDESARINITGGLFKIAPNASHIADGYGVQNNPDTASDYKYTIVNIAEAEAYVSIPESDIRIYYPRMTDAIYGAEAGSTVYQIVQETLISPLEKDVLASGIVLNGNTMRIKEASTLSLGKDVRISNGTITGGSSGISLLAVKGKTIFEDINFIADTPIYWGSVNADVEIHGGVHKINRFISGTSDYWKEDKPVLSIYDGQFALNNWFFTGYPENDYVHIQLYGGDYSISPDAQSTHDVIRIGEGRGIVKNAADAEYPWSVATLSEADCEAKLPKEHCIYEKEEDAGIYYRTIGTALNDVHKTKTVTLCKDATLKETVVASCSDAGKIITLDLNGKKLTSSDKQTISAAEDTTLKITSSNENGTFTNFTTGNSAGGKIIFENVNVEGSVRLLDCETEIKSGKWKISTMSLPSIESGKLRISGGKFNTRLSEGYLETGCYFFENPDDDKNDYPYLVDQGYTVSFVLNGHGGEIAPVKARAGYTFAAPATPSDVSYSFDGWFKESGCENRWNFDTDTVKSNMTLYAKWAIKKYTASFDMQGHGAQIASQSVEHGGKITKPADPTAEGYLFDGWFTKDGTGSDWGDQWNFEENTVTADITLHAKWTEAEAYRINSGSAEKIYFASLSDAVKKAPKGSTVYVLKDGIVVGGDSATGEQLNLDNTFTLDLNGKTLVSRFSRVGGQNKTITIQNGTLRSSGGDNDAGLFWLNDYNTSLVLNDVNTYGYRIAALSCDWDVLTIKGGFHKGHTIISANGNGSNQKIGISSGDFELDTWMYDDDNTHNNYTADVTGGNFKLGSWKGKSSADSNCKINIEGGNYNLSPDQTFATIKSGKGIIRNVEDAVYPWSVDDISICDASVPNISRVNNDTIYYRTIRDALADADRTETITLLKTVSLADRVYIGDEESHRYTVTIDLAGHTFRTTKGGTIGIIGIASGSVAKFANSSASRAIIENLYMDTFGSGRVEFAESIDFEGALDLNNHSAIITGGRWNISEMGANPKLSIIGGKFNNDYSEYLAEGTQARFYENTDEDKDIYPYIVDERHCTVSFDLQGHGEPQPATLSVIPMATISTPSAVSEEGYEFGGWFREPECANRWNFDTDPVESDMTLYAKWAKKNYNVYFNMNGHGEQVDTQPVSYGELVIEPETPQEEGYTFGGWFRDRTFDNAWNFSTDQVKSNMTLHAKWDQNKYEVSFDMHEHGAQIASQSVAHGGKIAEPPTPSETGYLFDGWFKEDGTKSRSWGDQWSFENDTVTAAVTLHAKWSEAAAVVIDSQNTAYYRTAEEAFAAAQNGDTVKLLKPFEVTEALTVNHSITLDLNGQTLSGNDDRYIIVVENAGFTVTDTSTGRTGRIENTSSGPDSYAVILTADDKTNEYAFTMTGGTISGYNGVVSDWNYHTLNISGGYISASGNEYSTSLSWWNSVVSLNISDGCFKGSVEYAGAGSMTSDGNITGGYYSDKSARSYMAKGYGVLDNTDDATKTEYPYMVGQAFRVEFELNGHGDTYYDIQYVANGGKVVKPEDPTEEGYTFGGWYTKNGMIDPETGLPGWGKQWNFETDTVTEDTTLYAKWSTTFYTVTFDLHGHGGAIQPIGYPYGSKVVEPEKPYEEGWVFGGWFKEDGTESGNWGEPWNFENDTVTAAVTLHAKWGAAEASIISERLTRPEYYTSLTAALASASDADTVTLYKTVEAASTIVIDKNITLDLNGRNISGSLTDCVIRVDGTSLKITDSTTGDTARGRIINNSTSGNSYAVALFGDETVKDDTLIETAAIDTLIIDGVAIEGYNAIWSDFNYDGIKMTSGSITARADGIAAGFWNNCMKLAISGGEIKGMLSYEGAGGIADGYTGAITGGIYSDKPEKTFINPEYGVADNTGDIKYPYKVVKLSETSYEVTYDANGGTLDGPSSVTVQYGKTIGQDIRPKASFTDKVLGGWYAKIDEQTWSDEPWNFDTDVVTENLTLRAAWADALAEVSYTDAEGKPVVTQYATLSDAADKAAEIAIYPNAVLKLMTNVDIPAGEHTRSEFNDTADKKAELTLDLNGYDITGNTEGALLRILGNGHLILKDSTVTTGRIENSNASGDAISIADGSLTIASGYITGRRGAVYYDSSRNSSAKVAITGGKIKGAFSTGSAEDKHMTVELAGGEYDRKSDGMTYVTLKDGCTWIYRASEEYPYAVVPDAYKVASYTWMTEGQGGEQIEHTEYFAAFEDAVTFANTKDEGILKLLKDYAKDTSYVLYKNVEIDLNDHALSGGVAGQPLISVVGANLTVYGKTGVGSVDGTEAAGSLSNTAASGTVISMSDPSKKLSIGSGRYQGSIVYENVQQGQKPAGDIFGGIYSEAPGKKEISGVIGSEGYLKEGYEVTDNTDTETKTTYPKQVSIRKFTVTFDTLNKDVTVNPQTVEYGQKATEVTPYVKDLAFEGWFEKDGTSSGDWGAKWSFDNEIKSDVELFAKWSQAVAALEHAGATKNYNSIADAVAAANAFTEGTAALTLLKNCDINATLAFDLKTGLTVDLKGKNLTGSIAGGSLISKSGSGKLTITDSADKTAYGFINNTGLRGGSISVGQGDAEIIAGKIRGAMSAAASQEKTGNITLAGGLYDSEAYASVNGTAVKLADGYVWLNRTKDGTYPYEVISGTELAATYTLNSRTVTFNSLESAVSYVNANAGGTLKLENSYPLSGQTAKALEFAGNITLDLNGKSITVNGSTAAVKSEGKISILDSSNAKNGSINNNSGSALEVKFVSETSKDIIISGGNFQGAVRYYNVPGSKTDMPDYKVEVVADIYGGAFSADPTKVYDTHVTANVLREGYGVTDNGLGTYRYIVGINNYTVTFNGKGGTFTETGKTDNLIKNYKHGDTIGQQPEIKNSDNTKLFDGWFTKDGTKEKTSTGAPDWGKKWNFSTDKIISNMTLYAKWGGRIAVIMRDGKELSFSSIQDAVDAAGENETITVLGDVTAYEPIVITGKKLTLDLGGYTITANPASRLSGAVQITGGDVTIKNGKVINNAGTAVKTKDGTVVLSGLTVTSAAAAALSVDGGAMTVTGSTVTGTTGITVNPSASGSGAAKTVTLKVEGGSRITGTTNDGINSFKAEYGTPETGGKVDLKLNNSTINGKDCGIKMHGVDEFDCVSDASTCVSEGDYAIDPGSAKGDFNWKGGGLEAAKEIFVISGAVAITVSIAAAFLKAKAMMSLKKAALIAGCTIAAAAITVGLFELLFNSGKGNKPKDEMVRIEYDSKGGSAVPEAFYVPKGTVITVEKLPGKGSGSECKGWRCDANNLLYQGGESYTASKDTLFTAEYRYKVTFDTGNTDAKKITSKVPDAQWIDEGGKARKPVPSEYTPIDKNYVLSSWKDGNADFNFETTVINKPYNLKANWKDRASVKVTARLKNDPTSQFKVDWSRNYKTLYEALSEANKPYNEIAEKALEKIPLDQVDISITVTLLDNFISSLNAQPVSGQQYVTYDVKNDMTLNLADYGISEPIVNTAVFTVDSESALTVSGAGSVSSQKAVFEIKNDTTAQKGGSVNITDGKMTAGTDIITFDRYGSFNISGGNLAANENVVHVRTESKTDAEITGGITGGYIDGKTNIDKAKCDRVAITGGFYTEPAKTAFDMIGLPAGYCWKNSGIPAYPWTVGKGRIVKFDAKGGIPAPADQTVSIGERVIKPAAMSKEGCIFDAWYTKDGTVNKDAAGNPDWGEKWAFETRTIADTDPNPLWLYAKWDGAVTRVDYRADVTGAVKNPTYHASVKAAFDTANADAAAYQITLLKDAQIVTGEEAVAQKLDGIPGTKNYTFDLGKHILSIGLTAQSLNAAITVGQGIDITVKNGEINGTGRVFDNGAVLTLDDSISIKGITDNLIFEQNGSGSYTEFKSGTFTALKLEPSAGSITLTDGKYAHIIYEPKNTSPVCSINGGVYDDFTKVYIEAKRALLYNIILNPLKPGWVTNTDVLTKDLYPWTLGDPVAYTSYDFDYKNSEGTAYHTSLKEAFEKASGDAKVRYIGLLKDITIKEEDGAVLKAANTEGYRLQLNGHKIIVDSPNSAAITVEGQDTGLTVIDDATSEGGTITGTGKLFSVKGGSLLLGCGADITGTENLSIVEESGYLEFNGAQYTNLTVDEKDGELICNYGTYSKIILEASGGTAAIEQGRFKNVLYRTEGYYSLYRTEEENPPKLYVNGGVYDRITKQDLEERPWEVILNDKTPFWVENTDKSTKTEYPWTLGDAVACVYYHKDETGIIKESTYHASVKEAFDTFNENKDADTIYLLKDVTIGAGDEVTFNPRYETVSSEDGEPEYVYFEPSGYTITVATPVSAAFTVSGQNSRLFINDSNSETGSVIKGSGNLFSVVEGGSLKLGPRVDIGKSNDQNIAGESVEEKDVLNIVLESGELKFWGAQYNNLTIEQNGGNLICDGGTYTGINLKSSGGTAAFEQVDEQGIIQSVSLGRYKNVIYKVVSGTPKLYVNGGIYDSIAKQNLECRSEVILNPQNPGWVPNPDEDTNEEYPWTLGKVVAVITKPGVEASEPKYYGTLQSAIEDSKAGEIITLLASVSDADEGVEGYALNADTTLDLDGHDITTQALISNGAELKDSKESAMIRVSTISQLTVKSSNTQLPVYDNVKGGYRLFGYNFFARGVQHAKPSEGQTMHAYKLEFTGDGKAEGYKLLAQGSHGLGMVVNSRYIGSDNTEKTLDINFISPQKDTIKKYGQETAAGGNRVLQATFRAKSTLPHDRTISSTAVLTTACGIRNETPKAITSRFYTQQQVGN